MLAADAELDAGAGLAAALGGELDQFADTVLVDGDEGVGFQQALGGVGAEEGGGVVAANAAAPGTRTVEYLCTRIAD